MAFVIPYYKRYCKNVSTDQLFVSYFDCLYDVTIKK